MTHLGLFEGIGGFSLAAQWMGWETIAWCEWNDFGQRVLRYHCPEAIGHGDITQTDFTPYANKIGILTGGFPCQPYSAAGKRRGKEDDRHLWPQMLRAIREIAPRYIVGENVLGLVNWNGGLVFDEVCSDLEAQGYEVTPVVIPAAAVNAPHGRDRVWFVAYRHSTRFQEERPEQQTARTTGSGSQRPTPDTDSRRLEGAIEIGWDGQYVERQGIIRPTPDTDSDGQHQRHSGNEVNASEGGQYAQRDAYSTPPNWQKFPTQSPICGGNDGLPRQLDGITFPKWRAESIKAYGNAIVPQVAYEIFKAIAAHEQHHQPHP